jgi:uncharacterized protein (DUF58 family)
MLPAQLTDILRKYSHTLDRMEFVAPAPGSMADSGRRSGTASGYSVDFADYRKYDYGDDIRYIDWSIYARLKKLFLRQFRAEAELTIHLLVDTSNSMNFGKTSKLEFAAKLAAVFGYVGLSKQDRVGLTTFSDGLNRFLPPQRGNRQLAHVLKMLNEITAGGISNFEQAFRSYVARASSRGMAVIFSDCFSPDGYKKAFRCLAYSGFEVVIIRILADEELAPELEDGIELRDLEHAGMLGPTIDSATVSRYRKSMDEYSKELAAFCMSEGIPLVETASSTSFEEFTIQLMRAGIWRSS